MGASPLPIFFLGLAILDEIFDSFRKIWTGQTVYATTTAAAGQITGDRRSRGTLRSTHSNPRPSCTHKHTITLRVDSVHPWTRYSVPLLKEYYHKLNDIPKCRRVMHQVTTESNRKQPQATASNRKLPQATPQAAPHAPRRAREICNSALLYQNWESNQLTVPTGAKHKPSELCTTCIDLTCLLLTDTLLDFARLSSSMTPDMYLNSTDMRHEKPHDRVHIGTHVHHTKGACTHDNHHATHLATKKAQKTPRTGLDPTTPGCTVGILPTRPLPLIPVSPHRRDSYTVLLFSYRLLPLSPGQDPNEEPLRGMIVIHQEKNQGSEDRFPIDKPEIIAAYAAAAAEISDYPELPQHGFGSKGRYGDWFIYNDYDKCVEFVEEHPVLVHVWKDGNAPETQIQLTTRAVKLSDTLSRDGQLSAAAANMYTIHVSVNVPNGVLFNRVDISHIRAAFQACGFQVFKANRVGLKMENGKKLKGEGTKGNTIHLNIRHQDGQLLGPLYPQILWLKVDGTSQPMTYRIFPHPELDGQICEAGCHYYTQQAHANARAAGVVLMGPICFGLCIPKDHRAPRGETSEKSARDELKDKVDERLVLYGATPCQFFKMGRCHALNKGKACKFDHEGLDPGEIECGLGKKCKDKAKCKYNHSRDTTEEEATANMHRMMQCVPLKNKLAHDRKRGTWSFSTSPYLSTIFDSTLGFPGEGPLNLLSLNINGLNDAQDIWKLLQAANQSHVDILFLQEHHLKRSSAIKTLENIADKKGWRAFVSVSPSDGGRGGTALLIREAADLTIGSTVADRSTGDTLGGRVCAVDVTIAATAARLVSVYAPVAPAPRAAFLSSLEGSGVLRACAICMGDWNCVEDPSVDVSYLDGSPSSAYKNEHGNTLATLMNTKGLADPFRTLHGRDAHDYTRRGSTVWTRLDRLYTPAYNSFLRWTSIHADPTFYRGHDHASDHLALIATCEWTRQRLPTKGDRRIDPRIFSIPEVRDQVRQLWLRTYYLYDPKILGHAKVWNKAKETVVEYLLDKSYEKSPAKIKIAELEDRVYFLHSVCNRSGPTPALHTRIQKAEADLMAAKKEVKSSVWWDYIRSLGEEVSSKIFYRQFKNKFSNNDISSLHSTPDWNDPDVRGAPVDDSKEIADELEKYYKYLFNRKFSKNADRMLGLLRSNRVPKSKAKSMDSPLEDTELTSAIRRMHRGKSSGPDKLPVEFYQDFEDLVTCPLLEVLKEALSKGEFSLPTRQGIVTLIYKKGDPRDVRNYRPITLLNVDYKLFSLMLVKRLKITLDDIVSESQLGFVPGRVISESTLFLKLIQAKIEEDDTDAIIVSADWEKAFDRVSWDYLHQATEALGFGPVIRNWLKTMYNHNAPPERKIKANGTFSDSFPIHSGVPQGCPASPIIFLLVAEALTRAIVSDKAIRGVTVDDREFKITQFADDTQFILAGYKYLKRVFGVLDEYEDATGMLANKKKFEGIRCGALMKKPVPIIPQLRTDIIKWVPKGDYVRILGIPFWENYDINDFYDKLYRKSKALLASWRDPARLTIIGKTMVVGSMFLGRFRYYVEVEPMPKRLMIAIESDVQRLIWGKEGEIDPEEEGSVLMNRRWMKNDAQFLPRKTELGAGVMHWGKHVQALHARLLLKYRDGTQGQWKYVLDNWLDREHLGRGAVFANHRKRDLTQSTHSSSSGDSKLPRVWSKAIEAFKELKMIPTKHEHFSTEGARAHPVWFSPIFSPPVLKLEAFWRDSLRVNTIKDLLKDDNTDFSDQELLDDVRRLSRVDGEYARVARGEWVKISRLLADWKRIIASIPPFLVRLARGDPTPTGYSSQSLRMMKAMGWIPGSGIGRTPGITTPVGTEIRPRRGLSGLGAVSNTKSRKTDREDGLRAVLTPHGPVYGRLEGHNLKVYTLSVKGKPLLTEDIRLVSKDEVRTIVRWKGSVVGIAESTFPHPKEWRLGDIDKPLDEVTVKDLTRSLTRKICKPPSCIANWSKKLPEVSVVNASRRYSTGILSPKDFGSHYKLIMHRALFTNPHNPDAPSELCRLCGGVRETIQHFGQCVTLRPAFLSLRPIDGGHSWDDVALNLFGQLPGGKSIPPGVSLMHFIVWKFIIIDMTLLSLKKIPFDISIVLEKACARIQRKLSKTRLEIALEVFKAQARGRPPDLRRYVRWLEGIGKINLDFEIELTPEVGSWLDVFKRS